MSPPARVSHSGRTSYPNGAPPHATKGTIMRTRYLLILVVAVTASALAPAADDPPPLKKGDKIVFLGDSITAGGVRPTGYVTLIKNALAEKHKELGIEVV